MRNCTFHECIFLGKQVQELQAQLILLKHEKTEKESQISQTQSVLEKMKSKEIELFQENKDLSLKLGDLQKQLTNLEADYVALRNNSEEQKQLSEELNAKNMELEQLKCVQKIKDKQIEELNVQLAAFKQRNIDLELDMKSCKEREAEMLAFTKQLTDKNVALQSQFTSIETKVQQLVCEQTILKNSVKDNETKANSFAIQLNEERKKHIEDVNYLKAELAEQIKRCEALNQESADLKGENVVLKRKLELSLREVNKELQQCRKKLEQNEISSNNTSSSSSTVSVGEGGSNSSPSPTTEQIKVIQPEMVIEKQTLIDHIVKLQRISARKSEKIDFLEEHINTLVEELQKKSRLLQNYMLHDHAGALTSNSMDKNKANIAKTHGIMASVYGSRVADNNLTLELSLDINRKLQAVLEDALLKNITLKENVDTLGAEIDRLNKLRP
ncbi:coiled-coil domain-containing protein 186 [Agrilus planipennis]|uniref:Coiled-coil domain-containing protein 186 n=2 Tax=Agrilus planipennis TaxID=224129 RepID=A0A7F5QYV8_AGRPL|nr:coiled-coil domain-containing protein 186 [Agrilus planipennis]